MLRWAAALQRNMSWKVQTFSFDRKIKTAAGAEREGGLG